MSKASLLHSFDLKGVEEVELNGLIVVVGPNSSGKSQLLHDINHAVCGKIRDLVVATAIKFNPPPPVKDYLQMFIDSGAIKRHEQDSNTYRKESFQYGAEVGHGNFKDQTLRGSHTEFSTIANSKMVGTLRNHDFLSTLGPLSCSALFLHNRLTLLNSCTSYDWEAQGPSKTLHSLYIDRNVKNLLSDEIAKTFKIGLWVDSTPFNKLTLRVSDSTMIPSAEARLEPSEMKKYRPIDSEGDGLRSYAAICATLLLGHRALCLLDEPEMCLHPPQAHAMGRFIGQYAAEETCTLVATHSSHVIRGIIESNPKANIIRLTKSNSTFHARRLSSEALIEATSKPRSRSEVILDGLLSSSVILCEAEGDRVVYESTFRTIGKSSFDVRFVPAEGTGGFAAPLNLYKSLNVPCAVVADLDLLAKAGEFKQILIGLDTPDMEVKRLCRLGKKVVEDCRSQTLSITPEEIRGEFKKLAESQLDFTNNGDQKLRGKLRAIDQKLYRLGNLKSEGLEIFPEKAAEQGKISRDEVRALLTDLAKLGLFLVPGGELESWLPVIMKGHDKRDKSRWAMLASEKIEELGEFEGDIWGFINGICHFLQKRLDGNTN